MQLPPLCLTCCRPSGVLLEELSAHSSYPEVCTAAGPPKMSSSSAHDAVRHREFLRNAKAQVSTALRHIQAYAIARPDVRFHVVAERMRGHGLGVSVGTARGGGRLSVIPGSPEVRGRGG